jgi:hypothetical protein
MIVLSIWELGSFSLGNLDKFCLGTWTIFTWELGRIPVNLSSSRLEQQGLHRPYGMGNSPLQSAPS